MVGCGLSGPGIGVVGCGLSGPGIGVVCLVRCMVGFALALCWLCFARFAESSLCMVRIGSGKLRSPVRFGYAGCAWAWLCALV